MFDLSIYIYIFIYNSFKLFKLTCSFRNICRCLRQYSYLKLFQLTYEKCTESSQLTSDSEHLASSHISQTSVCCRHILAYVVTPLPWPDITKVLFNKTEKKKSPTHWVKKTITQLINL